VHKEPDVKPPTEAILTQCLKTHKDGFGAMWREGKYICIVKGLFDIKGIMKIIQNVPKESEAAFHFRMATHGTVSAGNCHPFPLSIRNDALQKTAGVFDTGLMHNGIISGFGYRDSSTHSDTMNFIKYLCRSTGGIYTMDKLTKNIKDHYGKFIIFTPNWTYTWGTFVDDGGLKYSNTTYKVYPKWNGNFLGDGNDDYDYNKRFKKNKRKHYLPLVKEVNPEALQWRSDSRTAVYLGVVGDVFYYRGVTIFCESGYDKAELDFIKEEIDLSILEGEFEGNYNPI